MRQTKTVEGIRYKEPRGSEQIERGRKEQGGPAEYRLQALTEKLGEIERTSRQWKKEQSVLGQAR